MDSEFEDSRYSRSSMVFFLILLSLLLGTTFWMILPYVLSIVMGGIVSLMLRSLFEKLVLAHFNAKLAALLVTLGTVLVLIVPLVLLTILAVKQGVAVANSIVHDENFSPHSLFTRFSQWGPVKILFDDVTLLEEKSKEWLEGGVKAVSGGVLLLFSGVPAMILQLVICALSCFVFLLNGHAFAKWASDKIPLEMEVRKKISRAFCYTAVSTIWATLGAGASQSVVMLIAFLVLGVPAAFLGAGLTFVFAWIPMVGCSPVWISAAIYLITLKAVGKAVVMVLFGLSAGIIDNIIRPIILGGRSKIHPLVSLISIFGGIAFFGIAGVFLGPVLASILLSLLSVWADVGRRHGLIPRA